MSYEPFGWATYHYGFWHYEPVYGWIWIPGDQWFAARVTWMYYSDYVYWAPIPPPGYYIADPWEVHVDFLWVGVHTHHFTRTDIGRYKIKNPRRAWGHVPRAKIRREPPGITYIEQRTKKKVRPIDVKVTKHKKRGREYEMMILPPAEREIADRYEKRAKKQVVRPEPRSKSRKPTQAKKPREQGKEDQARPPETRDKKSPTKKKGTKDKKGSGGEKGHDVKDGEDTGADRYARDRDVKGGKDAKGNKDGKGNKDDKDAKGNKDGKGNKDDKDDKDAKGNKDGKGNKDDKDDKDDKGNDDAKDSEDSKDNKGDRDAEKGKGKGRK
jgi:hypothetical protein